MFEFKRNDACNTRKRRQTRETKRSVLHEAKRVPDIRAMLVTLKLIVSSIKVRTYVLRSSWYYYKMSMLCV